jgi:hypothetical protein
MANYYEERKRAIYEIDELMKERMPIEAITYKICMKYGFSAKIVKERAKQLTDLDNLRLKK